VRLAQSFLAHGKKATTVGRLSPSPIASAWTLDHGSRSIACHSNLRYDFPPDMPNQPPKSSYGRIPDRLQAWIDARKRHHLSHAHV
jgi:hypothetical protein